MKILVVGAGSIARRHLRNIREIEPDVRIAVWRQHLRSTDLGGAEELVENFFFDPVDAISWRPEAAVVANATSKHVETALLLARQDVHLFVEKPISDRLTGVDELIDTCKERQLTLFVGYNLRFCPLLEKTRRALLAGQIGRPLLVRAEAGQYLPTWRPQTDYRSSVSAQRTLGGGVLFELSHEIDYLRWLFGDVSSVAAHLAKVSTLAVDVEDTADIILEFASGVIGNLHLDMLQLPPVRYCRVVGEQGTLLWDGIAAEAKCYLAQNAKWVEMQSDPRPADRNHMYLAEMRHFIGCVRDGLAPAVDGEDAKRTLEVALAVKRAAGEGRRVNL